jgi:hypothetical protein
VVVWIEGEVLVVGSMRKADPLPAGMAANGACRFDPTRALCMTAAATR